jgi:integrase/recombinase XerC
MNSSKQTSNFPDLVTDFLSEIERRYSAPSTAAYTQALQLYTQHLRQDLKIPVTKIGLGDLDIGWGESFLRTLQETRSPETEHLYTRVVLHFYQFVETNYDMPLSTDSLARFLDENRRAKNHAIPEVPTALVQQVVEFAAGFRPPQSDGSTSDREILGALRDKAFLLTLAHTGLRVSEICGLRRQEFDPITGSIQVGSDARLPLNSSAARALTAYLKARSSLDQQQRGSELPLFARHDKRAGSRVLPISRWTGANIVDQWVALALPADVRVKLAEAHQTITPHTFRHFFVLNALTQVDQDVRTAQAMARHGDRSTTRRYLQRLTAMNDSEQGDTSPQ